MSDEVVEEPTHGRRDLMKKAAVAGAVAWTVPSIVSVTSASADSADCEGNCVGLVVGTNAVWSTGQTWIVPLSLSAACPTCITNPSVGGLQEVTPSVNTALVDVNTSRLRVIIDQCTDPVSVDVRFNATVTCNGVTSTCCVAIAFSLTPGTPTLPNICDDYTGGAVTSSVTAGACQ